MQRFSVSVDEELAAWIEQKADERGVSKAKVIRDAIETAQITGLIRSGDVEPDDADPLYDRIERLESRVEALESGAKRDTEEPTPEKLVTAFRRQLHGRPPTKESRKEALTHIFELLLTEGPISTKELKKQLYPEFGEGFSSAESMWQATQRHLNDIDGIKKIRRGKWDADPTAVDTDTDTSLVEDWDQS